MFNGFSEQTIDFLWGIRLNNEKSWFESHKEEYKRVLEQPMKALASEVYKAFNEKYPELGLFCYLSRIYRDARRLFGRGPYKDCLWFTLARGETGSKSHPSGLRLCRRHGLTALDITAQSP